ncbi:hypothetical protein FTUN_6707 [Frigoriglobus tundricola]|uniref:Uncharacterized protein n=1 Tax=Frigoriglobus tundricola TaxID=2774151 RepID=A0A6M5YYL3_9BACT|nr:hypothetical protein FTUN_6707 [Frigoriglobus tundricola]
MFVIPTAYKSKLPKGLSWPLGAEAISAGLADAPHATALSLWFTVDVTRPASAFQRLLQDALPYTILVAEYRPASRAGYSGSTSMVESGWYEAKWRLDVSPVPRALRAAAGAALRETGLPAITEWLRSSGQEGWGLRRQRAELVFAPATGTITPQVKEGA